MPAEGARTLVAMVGLERTVREFHKHAVGSMPIGLFRFPPDETFAVVLVGTWPASQADAVVRSLSGDGVYSPSESALAYRHRRIRDTDRRLADLSAGMITLLVEAYLEHAAGGAPPA